MANTMDLPTYLNKLIKGSRSAIFIFSAWLIFGGLFSWYVIYAPINPKNLSQFDKTITNKYCQTLEDLAIFKPSTQLEKNLIDSETVYLKGMSYLTGFTTTIIEIMILIMFLLIPFLEIIRLIIQLNKYKKIQQLFEAGQG